MENLTNNAINKEDTESMEISVLITLLFRVILFYPEFRNLS